MVCKCSLNDQHVQNEVQMISKTGLWLLIIPKILVHYIKKLRPQIVKVTDEQSHLLS